MPKSSTTPPPALYGSSPHQPLDGPVGPRCLISLCSHPPRPGLRSRCSTETKGLRFRQYQFSRPNGASVKNFDLELATRKMSVQAFHRPGSKTKCASISDLHEVEQFQYLDKYFVDHILQPWFSQLLINPVMPRMK